MTLEAETQDKENLDWALQLLLSFFSPLYWHISSFFSTNLQVIETRAEVRIPPHKAPQKFSHRIPHHKFKAGEVKDVPAGAIELDPASTPLDLIFANAQKWWWWHCHV